jgi:polar amino acid transport system substrate-binding protein
MLKVTNRGRSAAAVFAALLCVVVAQAAYARVGATIPVPASSFSHAGQLQFCSDLTSPPLESMGPKHTPVGLDIDLGNEVAKRLGVHAVWVNTVFASIIPALQAGHCDAIMSELRDYPDRRKVVDFVDYGASARAMLVRKGNPKHISGLASLCGKSAAVETGTGFSVTLTDQAKACADAGKPALKVQMFQRDSDAFQQLVVGHVDVYATTRETAAYLVTKVGGVQLAGRTFDPVKFGVATMKDNRPLHNAIAQAFKQMNADGTAKRIFAKWGLLADRLTH